MVYPDLNFKKNFQFEQGQIVLLKEGYYQVMGHPQQPFPQPDTVVLLRLGDAKEDHNNPGYIAYRPDGSDVLTMSKVELVAQLLDIPPTELVEILYA